VKDIAPETGKFIAAVRRRIALSRVGASIAIGIGGASSAGLALMPIFWWRGESALGMVIGLLGLGAIFGTIWGISRRPTRLEAAVEADRQLGLHDLFGTIELLGSTDQSEWGLALAAFAELRCRSLRPSDVIVNRIGLRRWAGVGILGGLLLTFALFSARPENSAAAAPSALSDSMQQNEDSGITGGSEAAAERPPGPGGTDESNRRFARDRADDSDGDAAPRGNELSHASGMNASVGSGSALTQTNSRGAQQEFRDGEGDHSHAGDVAAGQGESDLNAGAAGRTDSKIAASTTPKSHVAPWTSAVWAADAQKAINAGEVPDDDSDLVRDYFKRD
jgi:hypothetical protein